MKKKFKKRTSKRVSTKKIQVKKNLKIDESLLSLPHSSITRISKSLEKIENFSSDLAEKSGITGLLGRAVLLRAKNIRLSLNSNSRVSKATKASKKNKTPSKNRAPKKISKPKSKSRK